MVWIIIITFFSGCALGAFVQSRGLGSVWQTVAALTAVFTTALSQWWELILGWFGG